MIVGRGAGASCARAHAPTTVRALARACARSTWTSGITRLHRGARRRDARPARRRPRRPRAPHRVRRLAARDARLLGGRARRRVPARPRLRRARGREGDRARRAAPPRPPDLRGRGRERDERRRSSNGSSSASKCPEPPRAACSTARDPPQDPPHPDPRPGSISSSRAIGGAYHAVFKGRGHGVRRGARVRARRRRAHDRLERHGAHGRPATSRSSSRSATSRCSWSSTSRARRASARSSCSKRDSRGRARRACWPSRPWRTTTASAPSSSPTASSATCRRAAAATTRCASCATCSPCEPAGRGTDLAGALRFAAARPEAARGSSPCSRTSRPRATRRRSASLRRAPRRRRAPISDPRESEVPAAGLVALRDPETGERASSTPPTRAVREACGRCAPPRFRSRAAVFRAAARRAPALDRRVLRAAARAASSRSAGAQAAGDERAFAAALALAAALGALRAGPRLRRARRCGAERLVPSSLHRLGRQDRGHPRRPASTSRSRPRSRRDELTLDALVTPAPDEGARPPGGAVLEFERPGRPTAAEHDRVSSMVATVALSRSASSRCPARIPVRTVSPTARSACGRRAARLEGRLAPAEGQPPSRSVADIHGPEQCRHPRGPLLGRARRSPSCSSGRSSWLADRARRRGRAPEATPAPAVPPDVEALRRALDALAPPSDAWRRRARPSTSASRTLAKRYLERRLGAPVLEMDLVRDARVPARDMRRRAAAASPCPTWPTRPTASSSRTARARGAEASAHMRGRARARASARGERSGRRRSRSGRQGRADGVVTLSPASAFQDPRASGPARRDRSVLAAAWSAAIALTILREKRGAAPSSFPAPRRRRAWPPACA